MNKITHSAALVFTPREEVGASVMVDLYMLIYIEVNLLCVLMLLYILHHLESSIEQHAVNLAFKHVVISVITILMDDCLWVSFNGQSGSAAHYASEFILALYLFLEGVITYYWLEYTEARLKLAKGRSRKTKLLLQLPLAVLFILAYTSPWNGWMFYYDESNVYHRGSLFFLQFLFPVFYAGLSAAEVLFSLRRCRTRQDRSERLTLLSLFIMPLIGFLITLFLPGIPVIWPLSALSAVLVFSNFQIAKISTDSLTGLNNRRQFDKYLFTVTSEPLENGFVCLILMDIDDFKRINDTYGHYEGDQALAEAAGILKDICRREDVFLARYGGDEFVILAAFADDDAISRLKAVVVQAFDRRNRTSIAPYRITLSIGTEKYGPGFTDSIPALIAGADQKLYREKRRKKAAFTTPRK